MSDWEPVGKPASDGWQPVGTGDGWEAVGGKKELDTPAIDEFGERILRAGRAGAGGIEAGVSMLSKFPGMVIGGLSGLGQLMMGNGIDQAVAAQKQVMEGRLPGAQALKGYDPQSEFGNVAIEALADAREGVGNLAEGKGNAPGLRTATEGMFDVVSMALPLSPRVGRPMSPQARAYAEALARIDATQRQKANQPQPQSGQMELPLGEPQPLQQPGPRVPEMMERAQERMREMEQQQLAEAGPQPDMFAPQAGLTSAGIEAGPNVFPGIRRSQEMQAQRQASPYELSMDESTKALVEPTQRMEPFREGDVPFEMPLEQFQYDPYFQTLKQEFDKHIADYNRNMHNKDQADAYGKSPRYARASKEQRANYDSKAAKALEKANEALKNADTVWNEANSYSQRRIKELGIETPEGYTGSMWERPTPESLELGRNKALNEAKGMEGVNFERSGRDLSIEKTPVYRTGKKGRRQGGSVEVDLRLGKLKELLDNGERAIKRLEQMRDTGEGPNVEYLNKRLEKLYYEQMKRYNEILRLTDKKHPLHEMAIQNLSLNKGPMGRQKGTIQFGDDPISRRLSNKLKLNPEGFDFGGFKNLSDSLKEWITEAAKVEAIHKLEESGVTTYEIFSGKLSPEANKEYIGYVQEMLNDPDFVKQAIANSTGYFSGRTQPVQPLGTKGKIGKQQGNIDLTRDPEFLKFKNSLPEPMKKDARAMYKKYKEELEKHQAVKVPGHYGRRTSDVLVDPSKEVLNEIPGLKQWKDEIAPLPDDPQAIKKQALQEADLSEKRRARLGRQLVGGGKLLGFGTQNTVVRYTAQTVDRIMREAQRNIEHLILDRETGFKHLWERLSDEEMGQLWNTLMEHEGKADLSKDKLFELGLNEKQADAAVKYREALDKVYELLNEARVLVGKKPFDKRDGYIPSRFRGDFVFDIRDADGNLVHRVGARTKNGAEKIHEMMQERHPDLKFGDVAHEPLHRFKDPSDVTAGYQALIEILTADDPRVAALEKTYQEYLQKMAYDTLSVKKHFRDKTGVKGFEGGKEWLDAAENAQEGLRSTMNYMDHALKWVETLKRGASLREVLKDADIQKAQPVAVQWAQSYFNQALGRSTKLANAIDTVADVIADYSGIGQSLQLKTIRDAKYFATAWWLGFGNVGFSISQMMQVLQSNPSWMLMLKNKGAQANVANAYIGAMIDTVKSYHGSLEGSMTPLGREAMKYAKDYRLVEPKILEEVRSTVDRAVKRPLEWLATANMTVFEKSARTFTYMAWVHFLHESGQFKMGKELYETAGWMTDMTMVDYRMHERAQLYKNAGMLGESANALTTFKHNFYSQMWALGAHRAGVDNRFVTDRSGRNVPVSAIKGNVPASGGTVGPKGGMSPAIGMLGMLGLLSGALGLPGREDIDLLISLFNKTGVAKIPTSRELALRAPDAIAFGGLSAATGLDWSGKFSAANILPDDPLSAINPVASTIGSMVASIYTAITNPTQTNAMRAANELSPNSVKWASERYFTKDGMFLNKDNLEGKVERNASDQSARYWALRTTKEAREAHAVRTNKENDEFYGTKRKKIMQNAKDALYEGRNLRVRLSKYARDFVNNEGDVDTFINELVGNVETQRASELRRMIMNSVDNPQRLNRLEK